MREGGGPALRRLPLRVAGVIGILSGILFLAIILGLGEPSGIGLEVVWLVLMLAAGLLAWFADRSVQRGRMMAMSAAGIFFLLGMFSQGGMVWVFLAALVLSTLGFAGMGGAEGSGDDAPD